MRRDATVRCGVPALSPPPRFGLLLAKGCAKILVVLVKLAQYLLDIRAPHGLLVLAHRGRLAKALEDLLRLPSDQSQP